MKPTVVLLHGLARTRVSLSSLRSHLESLGYPTWARTYPSRTHTLPEMADVVAGWLQEDLPGRELVAVTHSLGGVLVRHLGDRVPFRGVVMLAPPNHGSRVANAFAGNALFRAFYGPAGQQVVCADDWPCPTSPFAVIAGTSSLSIGNPVSWVTRGFGILPAGEPSDGVVTVAETQHPAMADFAAVGASHTWIMNHAEARRLTVQFFERGSFGEGP